MLAGVLSLVLVLAAVHVSLGLGLSFPQKLRGRHVLHALEPIKEYGTIEALQVVSALDGKLNPVSSILSESDVSVLVLFRSFG